MKKKILVLQFRTDKSLIHERKCIQKTGDFKYSELHFINVLNLHSKLPKTKDLEKYEGIILGGSGKIDISCWSRENEVKIMRLKDLLKKAIEIDKPMLCICFGHQLISHLLGSKVSAITDQAETGTFKIYLNKNGRSSPIFKGIPKTFYAILGHKDSVARLPVGAKLLAYSDRCKIESYQIKNNIYCVQFHPELDKKGMEYRLNLFPTYAKKGSVNKILSEYDTPFAIKVVKNFKEICKQSFLQ